jgi:hypothetical protein
MEHDIFYNIMQIKNILNSGTQGDRAVNEIFAEIDFHCGKIEQKAHRMIENWESAIVMLENTLKVLREK